MKKACKKNEICFIVGSGGIYSNVRLRYRKDFSSIGGGILT